MAVPTIAAKIAIEGAEQIKKDLDAIGDAGVKAFQEIKAEADKAGGFDKLQTKDVENRLRQLGLTGKQAFETIKRAVEDASRLERFVSAVNAASNAVAGLGRAVTAVARVLGPLGIVIGAAAGGMTALGNAAAKSINELNNLAAATGVSAEKLDGLKAGLEGAGVSAKNADAAINNLNKAIQQTDAKQVQNLADHYVKMSKAGRIDFKSYQQLVNILKQGGENAKIVEEAFAKLGIRIAKAPETGVPALKGLTDELSRLGIETRNADGSLKSIADILPQLADKFAQMATPAERIQSLMKLGFSPEAARQLARALAEGSAALEKNRALFEQHGLTVTKEQAAAAEAVEAAENRMAGAWQRLKDRVGAFFLGTGITDAVTQLILKTADAVTWLEEKIKQIDWTAISTAAQQAWSAVTTAVTGAIDSIIGAIDRLIAKLQEAWNWIQRTLTQSPEKSGASVGAFARGGMVRGPGTATSDSILARLSSGEFVMSARAVKHFGSHFFSALNALRTPGFADGGLVSIPRVTIPKFAEGGMAASGRTVNVNLGINGMTFPMVAPRETAENLVRYASSSVRRSAGQKPSRYGR